MKARSLLLAGCFLALTIVVEYDVSRAVNAMAFAVWMFVHFDDHKMGKNWLD